MDFFYHCPSITAEVSVEFVDGCEPDLVFFDRVDVGSEDLKGIFPVPLSDPAVNITPEQIHPALPPTGLAFWATPSERKVGQETHPLRLPVHNPISFRSTGALCASPPHRCRMPSSHHP